MNTTIDNDLEALSKKLYLESPDLWIEFLDKVGEKIIDEMVLFFAIKYNMPSVVKFAIDNNKLNLDMPSKNGTYPSIRKHLLATSTQYNCTEALDLLSDSSQNITIASKTENKQTIKNQINNIPRFICQNCKCNIFDLGYKIISSSVHKFSSSEKKLVEIKSSDPQRVACNNCNSILTNTTLDKVENICKVQCCNSCGMDLTKVGILDTSKLEYDTQHNKFISKSTHYNCGNCNSMIDENQKTHFNL